MCVCGDHGFSLTVPKQKRWVGGWVGYLMYRGTVQQYIYIYMRGTIWILPGFFCCFILSIIEGGFFVDGKCGGGGLKTERRVGISGSFFKCVKERGLIELGGGFFFGDFYGCWGWGKIR